MIPVLDFGFFQIPTYFLIISLTLSGLLFYLSKRVDSFLVDRKYAYDLALVLMVFGFLGGRLFHVFYEEFQYYKAEPIQILFFWNGGFVFLGGLLTAWPAAWLYCKIKKLSFLKWADFFAPLLSLAHALGRVGCILSGCCFGQFCELPWAIAGRHPTAIYLTVGEFFIFTFLILQERYSLKTKFLIDGHLFFKWVFLHSFLRYVVEFFRTDFRGSLIRLPALGALSVSQVVSLGLMIISLIFFTTAFFRYQIRK